MKDPSFMWVVFFAVTFVAIALVAAFSQKSSSTSSQQMVAPLSVVDMSNAVKYDSCLEGPKKALLIGINYTGTAYELQGCQEDVQNIKEILEAKGFQVETITDANDLKPTLDIMQAKIAAFLLSLAAGETGVLWYSGHGLLLQDGDNAWVPLDFMQQGFLDETWIISYLRILPTNVRLFIGVDACHSGTTFNLKYDLEPEHARLMQTSTYKSVAKTKNKTIGAKEILGGAVKETDTQKQYELFDTTKNVAEMDASVVVLSASRDDQVSLEANENGEIQGAMTYAFIKALPQSTNLGQLQDTMRSILLNVPQTPQLSLSRLFHPLSSVQAFGF